MSELSRGATGLAGAIDPSGDGGLRSGVAALPEYGLLKVHGADAASFLQAQLTNDVATLVDGQVRLAGYCSVKGRLMASFWVWRDTAAQTFWLACSRDIAAAVAKRLSMFVLRAKARVEDVSDSVALLGILRLNDGADGAPQADGAGAVSLPPVVVSSALAAALNPALVETAADLAVERSLRPVAAAALDEVLQALQAEGARLLPMQAWRRLEVLSGIARIEASSQERFVPQMVNFELVGGVDFRKGCYPGQEVVARSQYLGKLKRRMFLGLAAGAPPPSGSDVHAAAADAAEPVGQVVLAAPLGDGERFVVLFESTLAAVAPEGEATGAAAAGLRIGGSPVSRLPLPYLLPSPAAGAPAAATAPRVPDAAA